ncbi:MAG TPA: hypothetical protein VLT89_02240 [Usitatibacter sp.]|nr:hypothetical protein [Usitatibacter sp.]
MRFSLRVTFWAAAVMSVLCFAWAASGFIALREITDAKVASDTQGYSWFWAFLGLVAASMAAVSRWLSREPPAPP